MHTHGHTCQPRFQLAARDHLRIGSGLLETVPDSRLLEMPGWVSSRPVRPGPCMPCGTSTAAKEPTAVAYVVVKETVGTNVTVGVAAVAAAAFPVAVANAKSVEA